MKTKLLLIVLTVLTLFGCTEYKSERKQVADLMDQLDEAERVFSRAHPDSLPMTEKDVTDRLTIISNHYKDRDEALDLELGLLVSNFRVFKKVFKGLTQKRMKIRAELDLCHTQLKNLDADLKSKAVDKCTLAAILAS